MPALHIENVRCFTNPSPAPIAPVTVLVGENSTGKSTFLAMLRLVWDLLHDPLSFNFNEEPFLLGSFHDIANSRGNGMSAETFGVGLLSHPPAQLSSFDLLPEGRAYFLATFRSHKAQPYLAKWEVNSGEYGLAATFTYKGILDRVELSSPGGRCAVGGTGLAPLPFQAWIRELPLVLKPWMRSIAREDRTDFAVDGPLPEDRDLAMIGSAVRILSSKTEPRPYATAPIRTKPRRTYDPLATSPHPEGAHIPMVLATTLTENTDEAKLLERALEEFGSASGLFDIIRVKRLGDEEATPFQIRLGFEGQPAFNLADVGYGVSQALPILVDILRSEPGSTLLIQQPEVHLHPRAQAELGTLLMRLAKSQNKRFVVETHSDYLVDRIRMEVRDDEALSPDDAQILYFQREEDGSVQIHPLELDSEGNITNAPPGYRDFFLREEHRFIGV